MRVLQNKRGMAYVLTCVIVLVVMMLLSVLFQYRYVYSAIREQRDEAQMQLDSVILKSAMENYDALKRGSTYREYIDYAKLEQDAYVALGFADTDAEWLDYKKNDSARDIGKTALKRKANSKARRCDYRNKCGHRHSENRCHNNDKKCFKYDIHRAL